MTLIITAQVIDFSEHDRQDYDLDSLKIDPIIVHLVTTKGAQWTDSAEEAGDDSNLRCRSLESVAQIMDLDLSKDHDKEKAAGILEQNKDDCYLGGAADVLDLSEEKRMRTEIERWYTWLDEGSKAYTDVRADEKGDSSGTVAGVGSGGAIVAVVAGLGAAAAGGTGANAAGAAAGGAAANAAGAGAGGAAADAAHAAGAAAGSAVGEKRKRTTFSATQRLCLEQALANGLLDFGVFTFLHPR